MSFLFCFLAFCVCSAGLILFLAFCVCSADLVLFLTFCVCSADVILFFPAGDGVVVGVSGGSSFSNNALVLSNKNFIFSFIFLERFLKILSSLFFLKRFLKILSFIKVVNRNNYCSPLSRH